HSLPVHLLRARLRALSSFDFHTKSRYQVRVPTRRSSDLSTEKQFTLSVTNVNEAPTDIALSNSSVAENAGANAAVGNLSTTDVEDRKSTRLNSSHVTISYADLGLKIISASLRATASFDFE